MDGKRFRASENFICRTIADTTVLISVGANIANFNGYIELNESAKDIWNKLQVPCTVKEVVDFLVDEYDITQEEAQKDTVDFLNTLLEHNMVVSE